MTGALVQQTGPSEDSSRFGGQNSGAVIGVVLVQRDADPQQSARVVGKMVGGVVFAEILQFVADRFGVAGKDMQRFFPVSRQSEPLGKIDDVYCPFGGRVCMPGPSATVGPVFFDPVAPECSDPVRVDIRAGQRHHAKRCAQRRFEIPVVAIEK